MRLVMLLTFFLSTACLAQKTDVLFLGAVGGGAPSFGGTYERLLREKLGVDDTIRLADSRNVADLGLLEGFTGATTFPETMIRKIREHYPESTLVVWTSIRSQSIRPVRRFLLARYDRGDAAVALSVYSLREGKYLFSGELSCSVNHYAGMVFFYPIRQEHVTATERVSLGDELCTQAAARSSQTVLAIIRSRLAKQDFEDRSANASKQASRVKDSSKVTPASPPEDSTVVDSLPVKPSAVAAPDTAAAQSSPAAP